MGSIMDRAHDRTTDTDLGGGSLSPEIWGRRLQRAEPRAVEEVRRRVARILASSPVVITQDERDDLEQEVLTEIWQSVNRSRFDCSAGFWGFVEVVTSRRSIDWLRARREKLPLPEALSSPQRGPLRQTLDRERVELASAVLAALGPPCRDLIAFRLRDDLSYGEIARLTGRSEGALRVQFHRCVARARKLATRIRKDQSVARRSARRNP